jgi:alpha-L-arabinofuranosidase
MGGIVAQVPGNIETGRWYDIRIETKGASIKCFLDGKLIHEVAAPTLKSLYASATKNQKTGEVIVKVVNAAPNALETDINLSGLQKVGSAEAIVLTSESPTDENSLDNPTKVSPKTQALTVTGSKFTHNFPGNSVTVLRFGLK